ncbi:conserved hypothetical protein [Ricinus communis]|uniref:Uncharacterized protein n=1 Tax=Ricinus communis TaxID=3988 RepID=B9T2U8_RICCO|nr:conserved hypothetical protein [Ricinus communis]
MQKRCINEGKEQSYEKIIEIVSGAVQKQDEKREAVAIKPADYGDSTYNHHSQTNNTMGYTSGY